MSEAHYEEPTALFARTPTAAPAPNSQPQPTPLRWAGIFEPLGLYEPGDVVFVDTSRRESLWATGGAWLCVKANHDPGDTRVAPSLPPGSNVPIDTRKATEELARNGVGNITPVTLGTWAGMGANFIPQQPMPLYRMPWRGPWNSTAAYFRGDIVNDGFPYVANNDIPVGATAPSQEPAGSGRRWEPLYTPPKMPAFLGGWVSTRDYTRNDIVTESRQWWIPKEDHPTREKSPSQNTAQWESIAAFHDELALSITSIVLTAVGVAGGLGAGIVSYKKLASNIAAATLPAANNAQRLVDNNFARPIRDLRGHVRAVGEKLADVPGGH
jgi:hypothetical protein